MFAQQVPEFTREGLLARWYQSTWNTNENNYDFGGIFAIKNKYAICMVPQCQWSNIKDYG